jgi:hypothetical protein
LFDFRITGRDLGLWEGRSVVAAAIENDIGRSPAVSHRPARIEGTIQEGRFSLSCPRSLHENYGYPSWAVYVDRDGDRRCSDGDAAYQTEFYGWNSDVEADIAGDRYWTDIAHAAPAIWSADASFCASYFE